MRTDQYAHQQATRVAGLGLIMLFALGLVLLVFGRGSGSTALVHASVVPLIGVIAWAVLAVVFHQHRMAALEALEAAELRGARGDASVFDSERADDSMVSTRRLQWMHRILLPVASLAIAAAFGTAGAWSVGYVASLSADLRPGEPVPAPFSVGAATGWQLAVCVGLALVTFIFSRFVAGMAKQPAWQNLRGGACVTVGASLARAAVAVGLVADAVGQAKFRSPRRCLLAMTS